MSRIKLIGNIEKIKKGKLKKVKIGAITMAGLLSMTSLTGCDILEGVEQEMEKQIETCDNIEQVFEPGTHYIMVKIGTLGIKTRQLEYHEGYEIIEFEIQNDNSNIGRVLYVNTSEVKCVATSIDEKGNPRFDNFGTPIQKELVK